jgi:hypothetical protein
MKPRRAAALALWYLMLPPFSLSSSHEVGHDLSRPLLEWVPLESYDTAADCNKEIDAMNKRTATWARDHHTMLDMSHAQCVATDDPRLQEK